VVGQAALLITRVSSTKSKDSPMETTRKKALEIMQKGFVSYKLVIEGWDVSDHLGDGFDLIAQKANRPPVKIELKAIDLQSIQKGDNATQHLSANEIVIATHLIITVFRGIEMKDNYIMNIRQFVENSGVKKYDDYSSFEEFLEEYKKLAKTKSQQAKNSESEKKRLDFDFNFNPRNDEKWKLARFKNQWQNLEL
jgi:hypothetical protein